MGSVVPFTKAQQALVAAERGEKLCPCCGNKSFFDYQPERILVRGLRGYINAAQRSNPDEWDRVHSFLCQEVGHANAPKLGSALNNLAALLRRMLSDSVDFCDMDCDKLSRNESLSAIAISVLQRAEWRQFEATMALWFDPTAYVLSRPSVMLPFTEVAQGLSLLNQDLVEIPYSVLMSVATSTSEGCPFSRQLMN